MRHSLQHAHGCSPPLPPPLETSICPKPLSSLQQDCQWQLEVMSRFICFPMLSTSAAIAKAQLAMRTWQPRLSLSHNCHHVCFNSRAQAAKERPIGASIANCVVGSQLKHRIDPQRRQCDIACNTHVALIPGGRAQGHLLSYVGQHLCRPANSPKRLSMYEPSLPLQFMGTSCHRAALQSIDRPLRCGLPAAESCHRASIAHCTVGCQLLKHRIHPQWRHSLQHARGFYPWGMGPSFLRRQPQACASGPALVD